MQTSNLNATAIEFVPSSQPLNDSSDIDYKSPLEKGNGKYQNDLIPSIKKESPPQYSPIKSNLYESSPQSVRSRRSALYASTTDQDNNPIIYAQDLVHCHYYSSDVAPNQMEMIATPSDVQYGGGDIYSQYQHVPHPIYSHHDQYVHSYPTQQQQLFPIIEQPHYPQQQQQQLVLFQHQHAHSQVPANDALVYQCQNDNFISPQSVKSISYESITTTTTTDDNNPIIYAQDIVNYNYYTKSDVCPNQMEMMATPSNVQYGVESDIYSQYQHVPYSYPLSHHDQYIHSYPIQQQQQFPRIEQPHHPSQQQPAQQPVQQQPVHVYCQEPNNNDLVYQYNYEIPISKQNNHKKRNKLYKYEQKRLHSLLNDYAKTFWNISTNLKRIILNEAVISFEVRKEIKKIHKINYKTYCSVINNDYPQLMTQQIRFIKSEKMIWSKLFPSMPYEQDIQDLEAGFKEIAKIKCLNDEILSEIHDMMPWIDQSFEMRIKYVNYKSHSHKKMKKKVN